MFGRKRSSMSPERRDCSARHSAIEVSTMFESVVSIRTELAPSCASGFFAYVLPENRDPQVRAYKTCIEQAASVHQREVREGDVAVLGTSRRRLCPHVPWTAEGHQVGRVRARETISEARNSTQDSAIASAACRTIRTTCADASRPAHLRVAQGV